MTARSTIYGLSLCLTALILPTAAQCASGFARSSASLRAGPGTDYPKVVSVWRGEALEVYGCLDNHDWCDVATDSDRGWFPGSRIEFQRDGRRMRLVDNFALFGLSIMTFGRDDYWGSHYSNRPWFNDRRWRTAPQGGPPDLPGRPALKPPNAPPMVPHPPKGQPKGPPIVIPKAPPVIVGPPAAPKAHAPRLPPPGTPPVLMRDRPQGKTLAPHAPNPAPAGVAPGKGGGRAPDQKPLLKPVCRPPQPC